MSLSPALRPCHDDFTNQAASNCSNVFDVRSVGIHEAGHMFGPKGVGGSTRVMSSATAASTDPEPRFREEVSR
ncbi:hypothetical protein DN051_02790 [Streptomyces cadmiisoli]|uniref:Peptidase M10 metallopeptidase domain-containing protein n=1 Tax=Streptomyces cadmiisoli TaxID=2184053 RepID=A0A2Z4ISA7_9ACTN|nr:hypothetical protein DN051_02790 [Streptomyces cadmiisoli]